MLRLHNLLQREAAANNERCALRLHQLFLLEFGEQPAHRLARRADDLGNLFVSQRQSHLRRAIGLRRLRRP